VPLPKSERLLKLLIMLLVQRHYVPKERIREVLYADSTDEAFERMFERDKEELRSLGVPLEVGQRDPLFDDEPGYRVQPGEFALPDLVLEPDEAAVLGVATKVWESARMADATREGLRKLAAAGVPVDLLGGDEALGGVAQPRLASVEPTFDQFFAAVQERRDVRFDYRGSKDATPVRRHLQPWGIARYAGRWYVVGFDLDRDAERVFRLSRVVGDEITAGERDSYEPPEGVDIGEVARRLAPPPPAGEQAVLLVRRGSGFALRRDAAEVEIGVDGPDDASDWDRVVLDRSDTTVAELVLSHGPDVVVLSPSSLRDTVVARLRRLVEVGA